MFISAVDITYILCVFLSGAIRWSGREMGQ